MDTVGTPAGPARVHLAVAATPVATLVLGHGAGGGIEAPDLAVLAKLLPARGITVVRVEQPWRVAGRKVATAPSTLDRAWVAVLAALDLRGPVVTGGRSAGARVACRTALQVGATGVVALAFPLHPPGRPERSRLSELEECGVPALVVQGERDPFGGAEAFPRKRRSPYVVHAVPGADHSFRVTGGHDRGGTLAALTVAVGDWVLGLPG
ncbi:MAG TPA: alpha/beta family hydrolase [Actinomycetes bacterium]